MNVKQGDLAVVVHARCADNIGKIVEVLRLYRDGEVIEGYSFHHRHEDGDAWVVRGNNLSSMNACGERISRFFSLHVFRDSSLRPIRDNDSEDETLTWAGKPSDIKEPSHA